MSDDKDKPYELRDAIAETYRNFQDNDDKLEALASDAKDAVDNIMVKILEWEDVFEYEKEFYKLFVSKESKLSDVEGNLEYLILDIRRQREMIRRPDLLVERLAEQMRQGARSESKLPATINVQTGEPQKQKGGSFYDWRIAVAQSNLARDQLKQLANAPTLTAAQKPHDVLDYATDIIAEFNKLMSYFYRGIAMTETFPNNKETRVFMNRAIRSFWVKFGNAATSFSRAAVVCREETNQERAESYALALTMVEQTRMMTESGIRRSTVPPGDELTNLLKENLRRQVS